MLELLLVMSVLAVGVAAVVWLLQGGSKGAIQVAQREQMQSLNELFGGSEYVVCSAYDRDGMPDDFVLREAAARGYELQRREDDRMYFRRVIAA